MTFCKKAYNVTAESIAIITARGGSKRIPRKNIRPFLGAPIISYPIAAALESGCFREVMVSTDDAQIATLAQSAGASVPFLRSGRTSDDYATTKDVVEEVLARYREIGREFQRFCVIYPTAPFVTAGKLRAAAALLEEGGAKGVVTAVRFGFPPQRAFINSDAGLVYWMPENRDRRSQDLQPLYHDAGQFYFVDCDSFHAEGTLIPRGTHMLECPETEVQDIDTEVDWQLAEIKYKLLQTGRKL